MLMGNCQISKRERKITKTKTLDVIKCEQVLLEDMEKSTCLKERVLEVRSLK